MRAAILREAHQPLDVADVEIADPIGHEVLIRTADAGVCHSDVHFQQGLYTCPMPAVLGHESAGVVDG